MFVRSVLSMLIALVCLTPGLARAQSPPQKYVLSFSLFEGDARVFAPRVLMAVGSTASVSKDGAYQIKITLPPPSTPGVTALAASIVLSRANADSWSELMSDDLVLTAGKPVTLKPSTHADLRLTVNLTPAAVETATVGRVSCAPWTAPRLTSLG